MAMQIYIMSSLALLTAYVIPSNDVGWWPKKIILTVCAVNIVWTSFISAIHIIMRTAVRRNADPRRISIRQAVDREQEAYATGEGFSPKSEDGDWEKIQQNGAESVDNGRFGKTDYCGIIGFFHPFA